jgi:hypothetical protein
MYNNMITNGFMIHPPDLVEAIQGKLDASPYFVA